MSAALENRMSEQQWDKKWKWIIEFYGEDNVEAVARREQTIADLFYTSRWSQAEIGHKVDMSQKQVSRRLAFGRFLETDPALRKSGMTLTEFENISKIFGGITSEHERFARMRVHFYEADKLPRPHWEIGRDLTRRYRDDTEKWFSLDEISEAIHRKPRAVLANLLNMLRPHSSNILRVEEREEDGERQFRFMENERTSWRMHRGEYLSEWDKLEGMLTPAIILTEQPMTDPAQWETLHQMLLGIRASMNDTRRSL